MFKGIFPLASLLFFCAWFSVMACSPRINPEKPGSFEEESVPDSLPASTIDLPVSIPLSLMLGIAEQEVDREFVSAGYPYEYVIENCDARYMYRMRRGPLTLSGGTDRIGLAFTGYYRLAGSQRICTGSGADRIPLTPWTPPCTCGLKEGERRVQVRLDGKIRLNKSYGLESQVLVPPPLAIDKCTVCFWEMDITSTVMRRIQAQVEEAAAEIGKQVQAMSLRPAFQRVWDALHQTYAFPGMGYLLVNPEKIRIGRINIGRDSVLLMAGITARPQLSQTRLEAVYRPLPELDESSPLPGFQIQSDLIMSYDSLNSILDATLRNKRIETEISGKHILVNGCRIYGAERGRLILQLDFSGSRSGTLYLRGKPVYRADQKILEVQDLDYDLRTKDAMMKTASWLFSKKVLNAMQQYARFDLRPYEDSARLWAGARLNREVYPGVVAEGSLRDLSLVQLYPSKDKLIARFRIAGTLSLHLNRALF